MSAVAVWDKLHTIERAMTATGMTRKDAEVEFDIDFLMSSATGRLKLLQSRRSVFDPNYDPFSMNLSLPYAEPTFRSMNVFERILIDLQVLHEKLDLSSTVLIELAGQKNVDVDSMARGEQRKRRERKINKHITNLLREVYNVDQGEVIPAWSQISEPDQARLVNYIHEILLSQYGYAGHDVSDTKKKVKQQICSWRCRKMDARNEDRPQGVEGSDSEQETSIEDRDASDEVLPEMSDERPSADGQRPDSALQAQEEAPDTDEDEAVTLRLISADARADIRDESEIRRRSGRHRRDEGTRADESDADDIAPPAAKRPKAANGQKGKGKVTGKGSKSARSR
jgi:hypothetical protein